jgi:hypothetical protein
LPETSAITNAGDFVRRKVHAGDRKGIAPRFRQQRFLHLPREREFALDALLLDQTFRELCAVDGERGRRGDQTQDVRIVFVEQVAVAAVDDFQRADHALRGAQRRAQDGFGDEASLRIDALVHARIVLRVAHDLRGVVGHRASDHALPDRQFQAGDVDGPGAMPANQQARFRIDQE